MMIYTVLLGFDSSYNSFFFISIGLQLSYSGFGSRSISAQPSSLTIASECVSMCVCLSVTT